MDSYFLIFLTILPYHICTDDEANSNPTSCKLPRGCQIKTMFTLDFYDATEYVSESKVKGMRCEINDNHFRFDSWYIEDPSNVCDEENFTPLIELRTLATKNINIVKSGNLQGVIDFLLQFENEVTLRFSLMRTIPADLGIASLTTPRNNSNLLYLELVSLQFDFFVGDSSNLVARSCQEYVDANLTSPRSIFQIDLQGGFDVYIHNCIYKHPVCPLIFKNANISFMTIAGMSDHFFRRNILSFTRDANTTLFEGLNSTIIELDLFRTENIPLDENFLNPFVFNNTFRIEVYEPISRIDNNVFSHLKNLKFFQSEAHYFRKLIHKQGIEWIRAFNRDVRVNLSDPSDIKLNQDKEKLISVRFVSGRTIGHEFLDQDFCLFANFPFEQLVTIDFHDMISVYYFDTLYWKNSLNCVVWWLVQYFPLIIKVYNTQEHIDMLKIPPSHVPKTCNFTKMLERCNKTSWKKYRPTILLNDLQSFSINSMFFIKFGTYPLSIFGLITNLVVIIIIRNKKNADIFKGFKQFDYLCLISLLNIIVLIIQLFSWISDCSFTINLVCLDIRKNVFIQFLRVIVKEALVVALRFMCHFAYFGFAFNRILLIGRDHPKFVEAIGKCKMKKFLILSGLISIVLGTVKGFKFRVNYSRPEMNYPFNNEIDIWTHNTTGLTIYLALSFISDVLNYIVYLFVSLGVDIYMLVRLRRTLVEKLKREKEMMGGGDGGGDMQIKEMSSLILPARNQRVLINNVSKSKTNQSGQKPSNKKKAHMKDSLNNAIRMVITNSLLNMIFKFPLCFVPIINFGYTIAQHIHATHPFSYHLLNFISILNRVYMISFILEFSDFLYLVLISIQLFFYIRFDLKMKTGFRRLLNKQSNSI